MRIMVSKIVLENSNSEWLFMIVHDNSCFNLFSCWLSSGDGNYAIWTFVVPMLIIILVGEHTHTILTIYYSL